MHRAEAPFFLSLSDRVLSPLSYTMGDLTLHDLREQNVSSMQRVVELGRQLGRPITTSLWSSRAERPSAGSGAPSHETRSDSTQPPGIKAFDDSDPPPMSLSPSCFD